MADRGDSNHAVAVRAFASLLEASEPLLTHNYVLVEALALVQSRLGLASAMALSRDSRAFEIHWIDRALHDKAVLDLEGRKRRNLSLVDTVSFLVMRVRGVEQALAFDDDFAREGFRLYARS